MEKTVWIRKASAAGALALAAALALPATGCSARDSSPPDWLLGTWTKTSDEDNDPADSVTFRANGSFVTYDSGCRERANAYFLRNGLVFLVIPMKKGPVALVFRPSSDHSSMSFTSPRTRNNAVYAPSDKPHCK